MREYPMAEAVRNAYREGQEDETLSPLILCDKNGAIGRIKDGDFVIFYDIRGEREIELTQSLTLPNFRGFIRKPAIRANFVTMIEYHRDLPVKVAFPSQTSIENTLSSVINQHRLRQLKIYESEKAVHMTYFFNGKSYEKLDYEDRICVESSRVADYSTIPEMSIDKLYEQIKIAVSSDKYDVIFVNIPNIDVIGHIENESSILKAVKCVDEKIGEIKELAYKTNTTTIFTADHGTVEKWFYPDGKIDTGHTDSPVAFLLFEPESALKEKIVLRESGELIDVAPTICDILNIPAPAEWTGKTLFLNNPYKKIGRKKLLFVILDGWGYRNEAPGNLIQKANPVNFNRLMSCYPYSVLQASGKYVGMPGGSVGNSEVGHLHLGAGRHILSDRVRIDNAIENGSFFRNPSFLWAMEGAIKLGRPLHLLGIISFYSSHGSLQHLYALMDMAHSIGVGDVYIHGMLGRRGEKPESGAIYTEEVEKKADIVGNARLVTLIGRYWSLDREYNWDRIEKTYNALVNGIGTKVLI